MSNAFLGESELPTVEGSLIPDAQSGSLGGPDEWHGNSGPGAAYNVLSRHLTKYLQLGVTNFGQLTFSNSSV